MKNFGGYVEGQMPSMRGGGQHIPSVVEMSRNTEVETGVPEGQMSKVSSRK
jgi:hypothetical protein